MTPDSTTDTDGERATSREAVACPHCGSTDTTLEQRTGSALCRMLYVCDDCGEPFELFQ